MSEATLLVHDIRNSTATLFVSGGDLRAEFSDEHPDEGSPLLKLQLAVPDGVRVSPTSQSNLVKSTRRPSNEYYVRLESDQTRVSIEWDIEVKNRSYLESEIIQVELYGFEDELLDSTNILM